MKYNFDKIVNRRNTNSIKWDGLLDNMSTDELLPLWVADMDFECLDEIKDAIVKRTNHNVYGYSILTNDYFDSIIKWVEKRHNYKVLKEWIVPVPGVLTSISAAIRIFTTKGDKVLIQTPVYPPFYDIIKDNGCEIVKNPLKFENDKYYMDFEDLEKKIVENNVKAIIISSPHNPVGRVWKKDELLTLCEICTKHNVLIISDEIHNDLVYKEYKHEIFSSISEDAGNNSIVCTAPSKTFNIAGLKVANVIIKNVDLRNKFIEELHASHTGTVNIFGVAACEAAYTYGETWLNELLEYLDGNRQFVKNYLEKNIKEVKLIDSEATFLLWLNFEKLNLNCEDLNSFIKNKSKLWLNNGIDFGEEGALFQRLNIGCRREILEMAMERLKNAIDNSKK